MKLFVVIKTYTFSFLLIHLKIKIVEEKAKE